LIIVETNAGEQGDIHCGREIASSANKNAQLLNREDLRDLKVHLFLEVLDLCDWL
jgi:hypothetical protein